MDLNQYSDCGSAQGRYFEDRAASEFGLRQEFGRLLGQQPENILILKMNYWLSL